MRPTQSIPLTLVIVGFLAPTGSAWSQTVTAAPAVCSESDEATKLYDLGIGLLTRDLNREALDAFQRSYYFSHCIRALVQIASAEHGLQRWANAAEHLRIALESNDPWIEQRREEYREAQKSIEEGLRHAGGVNQDKAPAGTSSGMPARSKAGWVLLTSGLTLASAGVASMGVAQGFAGSVTGLDMGMWDHGRAVHDASIVTGASLLGVGGAAFIAGTTLLLLSRKEHGQRQALWRLTSPGSGLALGWSLK